MLSTDLSTIALALAGVAFVMSVISAIAAARALSFAQDAVTWVQTNNADSISLRQMAEVQTQLTELLDAHQTLYDSHKKLRSRIGMREMREKRRSESGDGKVPGDVPDPQTDPEGWKRAMRIKLGIGTHK